MLVTTSPSMTCWMRTWTPRDAHPGELVSVTTPAAIAQTGEPPGALRSMPSWKLEQPPQLRGPYGLATRVPAGTGHWRVADDDEGSRSQDIAFCVGGGGFGFAV